MSQPIKFHRLASGATPSGGSYVSGHVYFIYNSDGTGVLKLYNGSALEDYTQAPNNGTLTVTQAGTTMGTFTANQSSSTTIALSDTKNTAGSTDTSSKLFLVGATSQAANPQTYSQDTAYVGTDGCLYSGGTKVLTSHQDISGKEDKTNKVTSMSSSSTDTQYPSAKLVYNTITANEQTTSAALNELNTNKLNKCISTTWSALKSLRDSSTLVPGQYYRITDYTCTTTQTDTTSAGHLFDIIVRADDTNHLNEVASACHHSGDSYFSSCDLEAWELKYCIDNDTDRFAWVDSSNGKGVIYYMKDEWNNETPYDARNIMFKRKLTDGEYDPTSGTDTWVYTFNAYNQDDNTIEDAYMVIGKALEEGANYLTENKIGIYGQDYAGVPKYHLNDIVFLNVYSEDNLTHFDCYCNTFGSNCYSNTFGADCFSNTFGTDCGYNTFGTDCYCNTFGSNCFSNTFENLCYYNTFENLCYYNTFGTDCGYNTFGSSCSSNTFASSSSGTAGNYFYSNTFENRVSYNILYNTGTASHSQLVKNYHIKSSVVGTSSSKNPIQATRNLAYDTTVAKNSSGVIKTYCETDLIA